MRQDVLARDEHCIFAHYGACKGPLDVAHVFPRRFFKRDDRYNPDSSVAMCRYHHEQYDAPLPLKEIFLVVGEAAWKRAGNLLTEARAKQQPHIVTFSGSPNQNAPLFGAKTGGKKAVRTNA